MDRRLRPDARLLCGLIAVISSTLCAQDLAPRAYVIAPVDSNAITVTWSFFDGGVNFNGTVPITNASGTFSIPSFTVFHSLSFFRRSANVTASLPYGVGTFQGEVRQKYTSVYRSGLTDTAARLSVNLFGGPALSAREFASWKQKILLGASLKVIFPTGQYDPTKIVNWGINRWAFKQELGYSERWGKWQVDAYGGAWLYTRNAASFDVPLPKPQTEEPIGSFEGHLSRDFRRGTWVSLDGNFWWGGLTSLSGIQNLKSEQTGTRIGGTAAWRFSRHQSAKISYSGGAYSRFGGNYQGVQLAWQYSWLGWRAWKVRQAPHQEPQQP